MNSQPTSQPFDEIRESDRFYRGTFVCLIAGGGPFYFFAIFFPENPFYYDPPFLDFGSFEKFRYMILKKKHA